MKYTLIGITLVIILAGCGQVMPSSDEASAMIDCIREKGTAVFTISPNKRTTECIPLKEAH